MTRTPEEALETIANLTQQRHETRSPDDLRALIDVIAMLAYPWASTKN
jgi:hypothetical protein